MLNNWDVEVIYLKTILTCTLHQQYYTNTSINTCNQVLTPLKVVNSIPADGDRYLIQPCVRTSVSDFRYINDFVRVRRFPPPYSP